jgi:uncharacterized cupredoxin-like copper-binding protein
VVLAITLGLVPACSGGGSSVSCSPLSVTLRDFRISASVARVPPGAVRVVVDNRGPSTHEFVVFKTDLLPEALPLGPDGLSVDEESSQLEAVDELTDVPVGTSGILDLHLAAGRYVLACNLEGHYLGGMRLRLEVA